MIASGFGLSGKIRSKLSSDVIGLVHMTQHARIITSISCVAGCKINSKATISTSHVAKSYFPKSGKVLNIQDRLSLLARVKDAIKNGRNQRDASSINLTPRLDNAKSFNLSIKGSSQISPDSLPLSFEDGIGLISPETTTADILDGGDAISMPYKKSIGEQNASSERHETEEENKSGVAIEDQIKPFHAIPGPKGWPIIGTLWDYISKNGYGFKKIFQAQLDRSLKYGPIYKEKIGPEVMVVITDPKEYSKVVRTDAKYPKRMLIDPMIYYRKIRGLPIGLFNATGEEWYRYRKVLNAKMLDMKEAKNYLPRLNEVSLDFTDRLAKVSTRSDFCMEQELFKWALESIGVLVFDSRLNCFAEPVPDKTVRFIESVSGYTKTLQSLMTNFPWYRIFETTLWKQNMSCADVIYQTGQELIDERKVEYETVRLRGNKNEIERYSILRYLLQNTDWDDKEINVTLIDLMTAAIETTCFAVLWTMYCLAKNPEVQSKLHAHVCSIKDKSKKPNQDISSSSKVVPLEMENLYQITYLKHCVKEALRLYPVVYTTSRIIDKNLSINSFQIPNKTHVQGSMYAMGRNSNLFDQPDRFIPERWEPSNIRKLNGTENSVEHMFFTPKCPFQQISPLTDQSKCSNENNGGDMVRKMEKDVSNFASLPWGHGSRMCIGRRISEAEMYTLLWNIAQTYEIQLSPDDAASKEAIEPVLHLVLCPANKIKLKLLKRR